MSTKLTQHTQENVVGFDITMDDVISVEELERLKRFSADGGYLALVHHGLRHDVRQTPASQIFHHHPQLVAHQVAARVETVIGNI